MSPLLHLEKSYWLLEKSTIGTLEEALPTAMVAASYFASHFSSRSSTFPGQKFCHCSLMCILVTLHNEEI